MSPYGNYSQIFERPSGDPQKHPRDPSLGRDPGVGNHCIRATLPKLIQYVTSLTSTKPPMTPTFISLLETYKYLMSSQIHYFKI